MRTENNKCTKENVKNHRTFSFQDVMRYNTSNWSKNRSAVVIEYLQNNLKNGRWLSIFLDFFYKIRCGSLVPIPPKDLSHLLLIRNFHFIV